MEMDNLTILNKMQDATSGSSQSIQLLLQPDGTIAHDAMGNVKTNIIRVSDNSDEIDTEMDEDAEENMNHDLTTELSITDEAVHAEQVSISEIEGIANISAVDIAHLQSTHLQPVFQIVGHSSEAGSYVLPDGQLISASAVEDDHGYQSVSLPSGMTALIQQHEKNDDEDEVEHETVELEDGTSAVLHREPVVPTKLLEGQMIQLEDGTTGLIQSGIHGPGGVQSVQLEDGSTAYISLFGDGTGPTFNLDSHSTSQEIHDSVSIEVCPGTTGGTRVVTSLQNSIMSPTKIKVEPSQGQDSQAQTTDMSAIAPQPHLSERALALGDKAYKCMYDNCGRLYTTQHHLKVHERSHTGDKPFQCEFLGCDKAFATGYGLKSHTRVHTGEKPYRCHEMSCGKAFKTSGDLQKHVRTHTGERPFHCPFEGCTRSFTTSNIRKVHIRTHTGERPYVCIIENCGKSFASATNYKNHIRIHTGEKPYVCTVQGCGKRFTEYSSLYKHHVVHTQSKPYICNHCNKTYRQTSTLAMHKRTVHNDHDPILEGESALISAIGVQIVERHDVDRASDRERENSEEDCGGLVINTSDASLMTPPGGPNQVLTTLQPVSQPSSHSLLQHLQPSALQSAVSIPQVQQVYLITDPSQLQSLKHLTVQQIKDSPSEGGIISINGTATATNATMTTTESAGILDTASNILTVVTPSQSLLKPMYSE